ncbi:hypothetical protein HMPREF6485_2039 [Segatella buccae ATCC 33574]|uniref:Uncharacterized protein n=1 Tax=Segatella buccae ATCC 33574 TaxID=873513 RepID=E6K8V3_9BACT|nr:hypothetical protein HMPREF6485_2039 [Segatella buccae ATCC 33574]
MLFYIRESTKKLKEYACEDFLDAMLIVDGPSYVETVIDAICH